MIFFIHCCIHKKCFHTICTNVHSNAFISVIVLETLRVRCLDWATHLSTQDKAEQFAEAAEEAMKNTAVTIANAAEAAKVTAVLCAM